jgi:hypothetical protein
MVRRMLSSRWIVALLAAVAGAGAVAIAWALSSGSDDHGSPGGQVKVAFEPGAAPDAALLESSGAFADAVRTVNNELNLPRDLQVRVIGPQTAERLGIDSPRYEPRQRTVYFPWSFVDRSRDELQHLRRTQAIPHNNLDRQLQKAMVFVLYHELSHGIVDVLDVPVVAGQEPTADNLATILAIASTSGGQEVPLSAAALQEANAQVSGTPGLIQYADDHGFDQQRAFDAICLVYGSSPGQYAQLVGPDNLPESRARRCPYDYAEDLRAWRRLLAPWLTQQGGLRPLH